MNARLDSETTWLKILAKYGPITTIALAGCVFFGYLYFTSITKIQAQTNLNGVLIEKVQTTLESKQILMDAVVNRQDKRLLGVCMGVWKDSAENQQRYCNP